MCEAFISRSVVFSCLQVQLHKASLTASAKYNAHSASTCCVGEVESLGFSRKRSQSRLTVIEHHMRECFHFHTFYAAVIGVGKKGNIFFPIMIGGLALKGNHARSRLAEVTHCRKGME